MLPFQIEGNGHPLLLIHGWGVTYNVWQKLVPLLSPHFQLILVELPGVGAASQLMPSEPYYQACADALEELRQSLNIEQWAILAYSTGTRVAEAYLQNHTPRVTQVIFLCPLYLRGAWKLALQIEQRIDARQPALANWILSGWRMYALLKWLGFNLARHGWAREWMNELELQPLENLKRMLLELPGNGRAPFQLPASTVVPALFIWGQRDALTTRPPHAFPKEVFIMANHGAPLLTPGEVVAAVLPFLMEAQLLQQRIIERDR